MFFSLDELVRWLGLTIFELWIQLNAVLVFSLLLALHIDRTLQCSWWIVFSPLFTADALNAYFCTIVFIRMYLEGMYKAALMRATWSLTLLLLLFVFKFLLCKKLQSIDQGGGGLDFSEVLSPIFILLQLVAVRACQLH
ncbi:transmembrane protein 203-like isoform X3 [Schistocerca piceifrons]|uniref:transmembrane protein 203-like isoform X3 n=1 Tax=Schistocerca piceifrons TaxID=274613 RepID=UPI001F5E67E7|nr:transmembrane protein 203-like isoform X3 [Schistocerca piceifrons]XP_049782106.1 transmembrane protein 203-like isoform X2 [Schistocerca cancellata]XP_049811566.1 transmembrane protein 203-like isoform X2 [Schistocerca nitens]